MRRTRATRAVACLALGGSGTLMIAAARERWWPVCRPFDFDAPACLERQSHLYDFLPPLAPWAPVGVAGLLGGLSLVLLGVAVVVLPSLLAPPRHRALAWALRAAMSSCVAFLGVACLLGHRAGHPVSLPGVETALLLWVLAWPTVLVVVGFVTIPEADGLSAGWSCLTVGLLVASSPLAQLFLVALALQYSSYDTTPWSEALGGICLVGAAGAAWLATRHVSEGSPEPSEQSLAPASR